MAHTDFFARNSLFSRIYRTSGVCSTASRAAISASVRARDFWESSQPFR